MQSVWLLLVAACGFMTTEAPIFKGVSANNAPSILMAADSLLLFALLIGISCLALIGIFLFKKRPTQFKLCIISILLAAVAVALEVMNVTGFKTAKSITTGTYQLGSLLPLLMIIFLILAARGIYKDEKLVKSLDRIR